MLVTVTPCNLFGSVHAIGSKSYAHRALIAGGFLQKTPLKITGVTMSEDVMATIDCLKNLGVKFENDTIYPCKNLPKSAVLNAKESASTLRFLLPVVASLGVEAEFVCADSLKNRPIGPLLDTLTQNGVKVEYKNTDGTGNTDGLKISGKLTGNNFTVDSSLSSQYLTGLMLAMSIMGGGDITVKGKRVSTGYIDITIDLLKSFGVTVETTDYGYRIIKNDAPITDSYNVEGDWSNAAFFLAAGALGGSVTVDGLNLNSLQKDKKILSILSDIGASVTAQDGSVTVKPVTLRPFTVDAEDTPDLVPVLAVLAAFADGKTIISNVSRLRIKESDRVEGILKTLNAAGITAVYDGNLIVHGGKPQGGNFYAEDHRLAMAQTILALYADGKSLIHNAETVQKSYPLFFDDVNKLGENCCVVMER